MGSSNSPATSGASSSSVNPSLSFNKILFNSSSLKPIGSKLKSLDNKLFNSTLSNSLSQSAS